MTVDVKRAYFYARSRRPVYVEIPIEDFEPGDEHMVGRLNLSLYGTRDAAQNWTRENTEFLESIGSRSGLASPRNFFHKQKELFLTVHGDDFTITGRMEALSWIRREMENTFGITAIVLGPDEGMENEIRVLNRTSRWKDSGITYKPDQRHAEIIIKEFNLFESSKNATGPPGFRPHSPFGRPIPFWTHEDVSEGRLKVDKVATKENPADILTEAVAVGRHAEAFASTRHRAVQYTCSQSA